MQNIRDFIVVKVNTKKEFLSVTKVFYQNNILWRENEDPQQAMDRVVGRNPLEADLNGDGLYIIQSNKHEPHFYYHKDRHTNKLFFARVSNADEDIIENAKMFSYQEFMDEFGVTKAEKLVDHVINNS